MRVNFQIFNHKLVSHAFMVFTVGAAMTLVSCGKKEAKIPAKAIKTVPIVKHLPATKPIVQKPVTKTVESLATIDGRKIYKKCQACHVKTGEGVPGAYPPLKDRLSSLLESDAGREYLALVSMNGVRGELNIEGTRYVGTMPRQGGMTPGKTAAVLNYIMTEFNGVALDDARLFTIDEIVKISSDNGRMTAQNVYKKREAAFGGIQE